MLRCFGAPGPDSYYDSSTMYSPELEKVCEKAENNVAQLNLVWAADFKSFKLNQSKKIYCSIDLWTVGICTEPYNNLKNLIISDISVKRLL